MTSKPKSATLTLEHPFEHDGREVTCLSFRRMKAKDSYVAEGEQNQARAGFMLFAALAGVDVEVIDELDIEDLERVGEVIQPLLGKSQAKQLKKVMNETKSAGEI